MSNVDLRSLLFNLPIADFGDTDLYHYVTNAMLVANRIPDYKFYLERDANRASLDGQIRFGRNSIFDATILFFRINDIRSPVNDKDLLGVFYLNKSAFLEIKQISKKNNLYLYSYSNDSHFVLDFGAFDCQRMAMLIILHKYVDKPLFDFSTYPQYSNSVFCDQIYPTMNHTFPCVVRRTLELRETENKCFFAFVSDSPNYVLRADFLSENNSYLVSVNTDVCVRYLWPTGVLNRSMPGIMYTSNGSEVPGNIQQYLRNNPYTGVAPSGDGGSPISYLFFYGQNNTAYIRGSSTDVPDENVFMVSNLYTSRNQYISYGLYKRIRSDHGGSTSIVPTSVDIHMLRYDFSDFISRPFLANLLTYVNNNGGYVLAYNKHYPYLEFLSAQ